MTGTVSFPNGSRLRADFATTDITIPRLSGFILDVAAALRRGSSLCSAARLAALRHPFAANAFSLGEQDNILEETFALNESLTFPTEPLPAVIHFQRGRVHLSLRLDATIAYDLSAMLALCGSGRYTARYIRAASDEP